MTDSYKDAKLNRYACDKGNSPMEKAIFILNDTVRDVIYPPDIYEAIASRVTVVEGRYTAAAIQEDLSLLADITMIFSGWGCSRMDADFLAHAPRLKAVFYGAGSIRGFATPAFWERDIVVTNAVSANAEPVAYFTFAQIIMGLKGAWHHMNLGNNYADKKHCFPGITGGTVGIISLGHIGRRVCDLLRPLNLRILINDPFLSSEDAQAVGGELCDLESLFQQSDVVSLHTPLLDETRGMLAGEHFAMMKPHSTFINTARGAVIREDELIAVLQARQDIIAVLDVTYPEPPAPDSPLRTLANVILTPHIAGAIGAGEIREFGELMLAELDRYLAGAPLQHRITEAQFQHMA